MLGMKTLVVGGGAVALLWMMLFPALRRIDRLE